MTAPDTTGIVERLRQDTCSYLGAPEKAVAECEEAGCSCALQVEAAALIESQQKEIEELRATISQCVEIPDRYLADWEEPAHAAHAIRKLTCADIRDRMIALLDGGVK